MSEKPGYVGKDLEAMSFAVNYHRWILSIFDPYLGKRIVEVGAGTGLFSRLLLERPLESLSLVEPSQMYAELCRVVEGVHDGTKIDTYNDIFQEVAERISVNQRPDSIIYVNVLEHIEGDEAELRIIHAALEPGGRVFLFVPAFQWLYGSFDREINHFRRYTRRELQRKCVAAGFRVIESRYFDVLGVLPWWVK